jgi:rare lipoprotein A (peptidoglycan hydrolase)
VLLACALGALGLIPTSVSASGSVGTTATYYHPSLHGSIMANGEPYNRWDPMIAACNWYALGTRLRVTRQETGETIEVTVKDRGSRALTLDLSEGGFSRLGGLREGRIRVWIEMVETQERIPFEWEDPAPIRPLLGQFALNGQPLAEDVDLGESEAGMDWTAGPAAQPDAGVVAEASASTPARSDLGWLVAIPGPPSAP